MIAAYRQNTPNPVHGGSADAGSGWGEVTADHRAGHAGLAEGHREVLPGQGRLDQPRWRTRW